MLLIAKKRFVRDGRRVRPGDPLEVNDYHGRLYVRRGLAAFASADRDAQCLPNWAGETCVIVASGPSASDADLALVRDLFKVMVINDSWRLAPWADVLYACDGQWWTHNAGVAGFGGCKVTQDAEAARAFGLSHVHLQRDAAGEPLDAIVTDAGSSIAGRHSGFQALNLAVQFGAKRIVLVGYDLSLAGGVHWHGPHPAKLNNPTAALLAKWARILDAQAPRLAALGVEVLNASPVSALAAYRKVTLQEALEC